VCALKRLFVGGVNQRMDRAKLQDVFEEFGNVLNTRIIYDRKTSRSRGFAFILFERAADADRAIEQMNGAELEGKILTVNEAKKPERTSFPKYI